MNARLRDPAPLKGAVSRAVQQRGVNTSRELDDLVACEVPVALFYNGAPFVVLMATPCDLEDLALGFSLSEGVIDKAGELRIDGIAEELEGLAVSMTIPHARAEALSQRGRNLPAYGGCGVCGSASIEGVLRTPPGINSTLRFEEGALHRALSELHARQPLNAATGATHAAAFASASAGGEVHLVREDVGRHNALDKLIGAMATQGVDAGSGIAITTSRASYELAMKAAQVGIPLLAAISAPTTLAIALAQSAGLCLVGFARDRGCVVYAHPRRLVRAA